MNKLVLTCAAVALALSANAQEIRDQFGVTGTPVVGVSSSEAILKSNEAAKSTGLTDTLFYSYGGQTTGPYNQSYWDRILPLDSGRIFGHNSFGSKAFAQLYRYSSIDATAPADTTYNVLGVYAFFIGTAKSTTKSITLNIWKRDASKTAIPGLPKWYVYGVPQATPVASRILTYPNLTMNTPSRYYFTAPLTGVNYDIYAGYSLPSYSYSSLGGDSVGLATSDLPTGATVGTRVTEAGTLDTLVSVNTIYQNSSNQWKSPALESGRMGNIVLFPLIKLSCAKCTGGDLSAASFTQNELKFYGNYPNPAVTHTNVKFALKNTADVTIYVTDITGKNIRTIKQANLTSGEHAVRIETDGLAAGTYTYLLVTSKGDGIGSQFTIAK